MTYILSNLVYLDMPDIHAHPTSLGGSDMINGSEARDLEEEEGPYLETLVWMVAECESPSEFQALAIHVDADNSVDQPDVDPPEPPVEEEDLLLG